MNQEHLNILNQGKDVWNEWRKHHLDIEPDFREAQLTAMEPNLIAPLKRRNLSGYDLRGANFWRADLRAVDLSEANLSGAYLNRANLEEADLTEANFQPRGVFSDTWLEEANLSKARLHKANFSSVQLWGVNLSRADCSNALFSQANLGSADLFKANFSNTCLRESNLMGARLVEANFTNSVIDNSLIYGTSAWNMILENASQKDLVISDKGEAVVTVDELEVGQFIYLILNNNKIRNVIDVITSKGVLILGRFSERKSILNGLRERLREFNLLPIVFDFDCPIDKDYTEMVQTLAGMSMFVIADITNPKSTPLELEATVKHFKVPYVPIINISADPRPFAMLVDSQKSLHWVLQTRKYQTEEELLDNNNLKKYIIDPAIAKHLELRRTKNQEPESILISSKKSATNFT